MTGARSGAGSVFSWSGPVGGGLLTVGLAGAVLGVVVGFRPVYAERPFLAYVAVVVAALGMLLLVLEWRSRRERFNPSLEHTDHRTAAWTAAVLSLLATGIAAWPLVHAVRSGLIPPGAPMLVGGTVLSAIGAVVLALSWRAPTWTRRSGLPVLAGLVGGAIVITLVSTVFPRVTIDAGTTAAMPAVHAHGLPTKVAWTWDSAARSLSFDDVVPTPNGVAVRVDDGVVALDGRTGKELWRYRVKGAYAYAISASPDGSWVLLNIGPGDGTEETETGWVRLIALNGRTGEVGMDEVTKGGGWFGGIRMDITADVFLGAKETSSTFTFTGTSLADGRHLWKWTLPKHCRTDWVAGPIVTSNLVIVQCWFAVPGSYDTRGHAEMIAIDGRTGRVRWKVVGAVSPTPRDSASVDTTRDLRFGEFPVKRIDEFHDQRYLVDLRTGRVLSRSSSFYPLSTDTYAGAIRFGTTDADHGKIFVTPFPGSSAPKTTVQERKDCSPGDMLYAAYDGLVMYCDPERAAQLHTKVRVVPWDRGAATYDIDVDLGRPEAEHAGDSAILRFPAVTVLINRFNGQVTALR